MKTTFTKNILIFILLSLLNTVLSLKVSPRLLDWRKGLYKGRKWEDEGKIYQRLFKVRSWKNSLPELSDFIKSIFPKKHISFYENDDLEKYLLESCRSELTHWGIILSAFLFRFWNTATKTALMVLIAVCLNLPYIIIQRYNRPRIIRLLEHQNRKSKLEFTSSSISKKQYRPNRILFISADDTGHGHKSITGALQKQIANLDENIKVTVVDGFSLGKKLLRIASNIYNPLVVTFPALWGFLYRIANHSSGLINAVVSKLIEDNLVKCIKDESPDIIVSVHGVFVGSVLNILEQNNLDIPFITFIADLDNVSSLWADKRTSYTLCPSMESKQTMLSLGLAEEKLKLVNFPVREEFSDFTPVSPRDMNDLTAKEASILVVNGSQGSSHVLKMIKALLTYRNCRISVLAGRNESLKKYLEHKLEHYGDQRVQIFGFTKEMKNHMLDADIIVGRASPNVLMEAVNLCKPIIVIGALAGQEEKNPEFVVRHNLGVYCKDISKLPDIMLELLSDNGKKLREIYSSQLRFKNPQAAREIAEFIISVDCSPAGFSTLSYRPDDDRLHMMEQSRT